MAARAKETGRRAQLTRSGNLITLEEIRRQNSVLRRLIHHVRTFSPETGGRLAEEPASREETMIEQPLAHRRPFVERGQLD